MASPQYTIVVAEDDTAINDLLCELLTDEGYAVTGCFSGIDAYTTAAQLKPNAVITDLHMETIHAGFHLLESLRTNPETTHVGVIICSAYSIELDLLRPKITTLSARICPKPFHLQQLLTLLEAVLTE